MAKLSPREREIAVKAITKAIGYAENGGAPDVVHPKAGKTGEMKSIFQYTPATWKAYAKQYLGDENAPLTPDSETTVTMKKVGDFLDEGYDAKQIASVWNSGDKNAYTGKFSNGNPSVGVNKKYGVKFDVPAYSSNVNKYAKQFYDEMSSSQPTAIQQPQIKPISIGTQPPRSPNSGLLVAAAAQPSIGQKP
jgi:hypothetical protein